MAMSVDLWQPAPVMPTQSLPQAKAGVGIQVFVEARAVRRGWWAFAHHDDGVDDGPSPTMTMALMMGLRPP